MTRETSATQTSAKERARLLALQSYEIMDTAPERVFDEFARLAVSIISTPIALVSFVDEERQWFKASIGLEAKQTARELAFCAHAIQTDRVFVIPDATHDERFAHNPLVTSGPKIRFYAGAPLINQEGHALGTLCVIDSIPRDFNAEQQESLLELSRLLMAQLEMRRTLRRFRRNNPTRQRTLTAIRKGIEANEFRLHYQTTVDARTGHIAITLAHSLDLNVVAEGVETEEQRRLLRLLRCDQMQGYLFGKPIAGEEMKELLRTDQSDVTAEWQSELASQYGPDASNWEPTGKTGTFERTK